MFQRKQAGAKICMMSFSCFDTIFGRRLDFELSVLFHVVQLCWHQRYYSYVKLFLAIICWVFSVSSPPPALLTKLLFPPLADMLSWAVWFKFLLNKVIANTCLFILTSFSEQSASWKVLEICELCALSTDSRKTYSVNKYMYTGSSSYSFDWGGNNPLGGKKRKRPQMLNWSRVTY